MIESPWFYHSWPYQEGPRHSIPFIKQTGILALDAHQLIGCPDHKSVAAGLKFDLLTARLAIKTCLEYTWTKQID